ncbi:MAG: AMIN domain-containing protein [Polaromonas sp.]|nr:AMIN domain-containing protein [Polaromonas sp.]
MTLSFLMIGPLLSRRPAHEILTERVHRCSAWAVLLLVLAPGWALAGIPISAASLERAEGRTRIVIESKAEIRFSLFIWQNPERVVLELEGVALNPVLAGLADQIAADHPYMKPMQIRPSPSGAEAVQLEFGLKAEAEPSIRALKPEAGHGYRLVLDIVPLAAAAPSSSADMPQLPQPLAATASPAASLAALPVSPAGGQLPLRRGDDPNLVLLEVQLDGNVLAEAITTYQIGRETFLPLGEVARLLTLAIRAQPEQGTAEGFVLSEARSFSLNVAQARITLADQTQGFDPALVRLQSDDIYVASTLLSRWLPLDLEVNLSSLTLRVQPRERLPLQERLERERLGARAGARTAGYEAPGYPRQDMSYRLLGVPFIDQTLGLGLRTGNGSRQTSANYTAYLTGDLLGMESAFFVSSTKDNPTPDVRFTLARHDPDAGLLGPLHASSLMFGSGVSLPSVANIASSSPTGKGYGLSLSNRPMTQPTSFDRHTLRGDLPPGWDVELYFNEALVGFQTSRADGRYSFDDQPLAYGPNEFRLVFHGPLGQQRVERQSFLLDQSSTPPGAFYYNLAQHQDSAGLSRSVAQFEWGLNKSLTATGGLVRLPGLAGSNSADGQLYTNLGLRSFWQSFIVSSDFFSSPHGGWLNESGLKTRVGSVALSYSHTQLHDFSSELFLPSVDPLRTRDKVRLDGAIAAGFLPRLPLTLELQREQFQSGSTNLALTGRVAAYVNRTSVANQLTLQTSGGNTSASGALQLSRRVGDIGLSGQLGYSLKPQAKLETVALAGDKRLGEAYLLNLGLVRSVSGHETLYTAGLNKSLGRYGLGLSTSYSSSGVFAVGLQLFIAMGREPRQAQWRFDALPKADGGAASVRVFLDDNGNGVMDPGEEPIENVAMTVNGSRAPVRTDAAGIAWLDRLPIRQQVDIAVDTQTLEDPYWVPQRKGVRLVPRPGRVAELDFPVILTSEIDGTVYLVEKTARRGMGDVVIELLDLDRRVVSSIKSSSDGYYIVPAVAQGRYHLRIAPEQLKQFDLIDPGEREIAILPDGKFINGVDFLLRRNLAGTVSGLPREASHEKK